MKTLAIVILNYNGKKHLQTYLPSVVECSDGHDILVIDNGSLDDSIHYISLTFPTVQLIQLKKNVGFAQGYNDGLTRIKGKYEHYLLLNSDVEVSSGYLSPLLSRIAGPSIAAVQPKILSHTDKTRFEHAGASGGFLDTHGFPFCRGRIFDACETDRGQYDESMPVFWASGACLLIKSTLFHEVNGFDGKFFAHMEEIDLCWRLQHKGYQIWVEPSSTVYHLGGGTLSYESSTKVFLNFRNNLYMLAKNETGFWQGKIFIRMLWDGLAAVQFLLKGKPSLLYQVLKAHIAFYGALPRLISQRPRKKNTVLGRYKGNIVIDYFLKKKNKYSDLNL
jgi:GT2 family glycosyltransferase